MKTDLQKFQEFLDEMNIKYHTYISEKDKYMWIDDTHLVVAYASTLKILFDNDDNFVKFEVWDDD